MKEKYEVKDFVIEQTGGYVYVAWGSFTNKTYFCIGSDIVLIYDKDEYKAMDKENYDGYEWEQKHTIESYSYDSKEYKYILKQIYNKYENKAKDMMDLFHYIDEEVK